MPRISNSANVTTARFLCTISLILLFCVPAAYAVSSAPGGAFNKDAIVIVQNRYGRLAGTANGFVIGDGDLVVVNCHAVERPDDSSKLSTPMIISPYLADACYPEVLFVNSNMDIAILRTPWHGHPAVKLATASEIMKAGSMTVAAYPCADMARMLNDGVPEVSYEQLRVDTIGMKSNRPNMITLFDPVDVGPGWSGGVFVIPQSGKVAGIFAIRTDDGLIGNRAIASCTSNILAEWMRNLTKHSSKVVRVPVNPDSGKAYRAIMQTLEAKSTGNKDQGLSSARELVQLRPDAVAAHILLAQAASLKDDLELAEDHYRKAVALAPENPLVVLEYALALEKQGNTDKALSNYLDAIKLSNGEGPAGIDPVADLPGKLGMLDQSVALEKRASVKKAPALVPTRNDDSEPLRIRPSSRRYQDAVVIVRNQAGKAVKASNGVVVGDGTLVVTNWSTIAYFSEKGQASTLVEPMVISRYLGDACDAEIVYTNRSSDLAVLRVPWRGHPTMPLASAREIRDSENATLIACPEIPRVCAQEWSGDWNTQLSIQSIGTRDGKPHDLLLHAAVDVSQLWRRGAAIVAPESGNLLAFVSYMYSSEISTGCTSNITSSIISRKTMDAPNTAHSRAVSQNPKADKAYQAILRICKAIFIDDPNEMIAAAREMILLQPQSPKAHLLMASAALRTGDRIIVERESKEALRLAPDLSAVHRQRARLLATMERPREALAEYRQAMRFAGDSFVQYVEVLEILSQLGRKEEAETLARRALDIYPDDADIWVRYAIALGQVGKEDEAIKAIEISFDLSPENYANRIALADELSKTGRVDAAETNYQKALKYERANASLWFRYAQFLVSYQPSKQDRAVEALENAQRYAGQDQGLQEQISDLRTRLKNENSKAD